MERAVAIKKLGQLLGKNLGYRVNPKAPTQDERDAAQTELADSTSAFEELKVAREARLQEVLAADAVYQHLKAECQTVRERREKLAAITRCFKITVGTTSQMFFMVKAEGDSWEDVIRKLTKKEAA